MIDIVAEQLISSGEFRKAADRLRTKPGLSDQDRVLLSWAELELGDTRAAMRHASEIPGQRMSADQRARVLGVQGRAQGNQGLTHDGLVSLQKAVALAASPNVQAELLAHYVAAALSWVGVEPALSELPRLRRLALESANRPALIEFHIVHARIAALRGWWHKVYPELRAAEVLLETQPHLKLQWRLEQVHASISIMCGDLSAAIHHGERCLELSEVSGSKSSKASTLANLAHIWAVAGDFDRARRFLAASHELLDTLSHIRFATANTGINIGLACNDDEYARSMISEGDRLAVGTPDRAYYRLWFILHRVRWLVHCNQFADADREAHDALRLIGQLADTELVDRMRLLRAEALWQAQRTSSAVDLFAQVAKVGELQTLEVQAEIHRTAAVLLSKVDENQSIARLSSAWRILTAVGLSGVRSDVQRTARQLSLAINFEQGSSATLTIQELLQRISQLLRLGRYPRVLAFETVALLKDLDVCDGTRIIELSTTQRSEIASTGCFSRRSAAGKVPPTERFEIKSEGSTSWLVIEAAPRDAYTFAFVGVAIEQVIRTAIAFAGIVHKVETPLPWPSVAAGQHHGLVIAADSMLELLGTTKRLAQSNITGTHHRRDRHREGTSRPRIA